MPAKCVVAALLSLSVPACSQLVLLQKHAEAIGRTLGESVGLGNTVPLSENGYKMVTDLKNDVEMKMFIHRLVETEGRYVKDVGELSGLVPFYSGTQGVQNFDNLKHELRRAWWVADGVGRTAALNEVGYQQVAAHKSRPHMMAFSRRILDAAHRKSADEGALRGIVPYYDGEVSTQSFDRLREELLAAKWGVDRVSEEVLPPAPSSEESPAPPAPAAVEIPPQNLHVSRDGAKAETKTVAATSVTARGTAQEDGWNYYTLDKSEVASRGSYCMDGSSPGYYYKEGTSDNKWTISFEGGSMYCYDDESCRTLLQGSYLYPARVTLQLYDSEDFSDFNHLQLHHCDGGAWMGDADNTVRIGGKNVYFRGKRVLEHVLDAVQQNSTLGSAQEVLVLGGSGGGHATVLLADRLKELLPHVTKFGAVPMSGWYATHENYLEDVFSMQAMSQGIAPGCRDALSSSEQHNCLKPEVVYEHSETKMFIVQMLDSQSLAGKYDDSSEIVAAWQRCLEHGGSSSCDSSSVEVLQEYMHSLVNQLQSMTKYNQKGEGGFLSTCTKHVFYKEDEYSNYAINGMTIEKAISDWWKNLQSAAAKWYLPCELDSQRPQQCQCEESCSYDSGKTD